jgi:hypothetical protein
VFAATHWSYAAAVVRSVGAMFGFVSFRIVVGVVVAK